MYGNDNDKSELVTTLKAAGKKGILYGAGIFTAIVIGFNSYTIVDSSESVRIQNSLTGGFAWHQTEGVKLKVPFFSRVETYNTVSTVAITDDKQLIDTASAVRSPLLVSFADNYGGHIEASWRVKLPSSDALLENFHQDVKGQTNYEGNTLLTFARDMLNLTTDQFLAQDFMQGGKGAFKQRLDDQAANGMLITKRQKVNTVGQTADQALSGNRSEVKTTEQFIYQVVIQTGPDGITPLRRDHSLKKYGIEITQVDLGEFVPQPDLVAYVNTIKVREKDRAGIVAEQRTERDKAVTEQLKGDRERITAKNKSLMEKDREVIEGQKHVELATIRAKREIVERNKVAELAIIDKTRELQVAKSNEGIQKANATAAKYEAIAIKETGFAMAAVKKADYAAIDKEILISNNNRDVALAMYGSDMSITMPQYLNIGGEAANQTSVEQMSTLKMMEQLRATTENQK